MDPPSAPALLAAEPLGAAVVSEIGSTPRWKDWCAVYIQHYRVGSEVATGTDYE